MNGLLAWTMAGAHLTLVVFLIVGAWWPGLRWAHDVAALATATVFLLGADCPLTVWEDALRGFATEKGFIELWLHALLFYDFPGWVFTAGYVFFAGVVAATWYWVRPAPRVHVA